MIRPLAILTAIFLVGTLAQCPSSFVLSTGVKGQTYYFNAFSPYTSENSSPPTLFTDRTNATLFSLSSNGTAVAQVPATPSGPFAGQDLIKFTEGQVLTEPLLILYAAQNRRDIYSVTVQCAADATVTFTLYGLDENETPVEPEISTGFLACQTGDGGQLQLFNAGTPNHPNVGAPDINACITGLTVKAITAEDESSLDGATSSEFVTDSSNIAVSTRPTTAAWRFTNSTTSGVEIGTAASGYAGSAGTFDTNDAVIISLPTPGSGNFVPTTPIFNSSLGAPTPVVPIGQTLVYGIPVSLSNGQVVGNDIPIASATIALVHPLLTVYEVVFTTTVEESFTYECAGSSLTITRALPISVPISSAIAISEIQVGLEVISGEIQIIYDATVTAVGGGPVTKANMPNQAHYGSASSQGTGSNAVVDEAIGQSVNMYSSPTPVAGSPVTQLPAMDTALSFSINQPLSLAGPIGTSISTLPAAITPLSSSSIVSYPVSNANASQAFANSCIKTDTPSGRLVIANGSAPIWTIANVNGHAVGTSDPNSAPLMIEAVSAQLFYFKSGDGDYLTIDPRTLTLSFASGPSQGSGFAIACDGTVYSLLNSMSAVYSIVIEADASLGVVSSAPNSTAALRRRSQESIQKRGFTQAVGSGVHAVVDAFNNRIAAAENALNAGATIVKIFYYGLPNPENPLPRCPEGQSATQVIPLVSSDGDNPLLPNGCGGASGISYYVVPNYFFQTCCNQHDICFSDCSTVYQDCNDQLLNCAQAACLSQFGDKTDIINEENLRECQSVALWYWAAVSAVDSFFIDATAQACRCESQSSTVSMLTATSSDLESTVIAMSITRVSESTSASTSGFPACPTFGSPYAALGDIEPKCYKNYGSCTCFQTFVDAEDECESNYNGCIEAAQNLPDRAACDKIISKCSDDASADLGNCDESLPFPFGGYNTQTDVGDPYTCLEIGYSFLGLSLEFSDYIGGDPCKDAGFDSICCPCELK